MGDCIITPQEITDFSLQDQARLQGSIAKVLAQATPWTNILQGGVLSNASRSIRTAIQEPAVLANSLVRPVFVADVSMCERTGTPDRVGSTEYTYSLASLRGKGPKVCVKEGRTAFLESYTRAEESLKKGITRLFAADIKSTLLLRSGSKGVVNCTKRFYEMVGDSEQQAVDTPFPDFLPQGVLSFKALQRFNSFLKEDLMSEPFSMDGSEPITKFIGSYEQIDRFRDELNIKDDLRSLTNGSFQIGKQAITGYRWMGPYRGIAFAVDPQPLRYNELITTEDIEAEGSVYTEADLGQPKLLEPEVAVEVTTGWAARRNPEWVNALYEIGFLINADSFARLLPNNWTGEASFKFAKQLYSGELLWHYNIDNDCNEWGDTGYHKYQISRAYRPERPHAVMPIAYERDTANLEIPAVVSSANCI